MARRKLSALNQARIRSAVTNGSQVLLGIDHRTAWMRRIRDLLSAHEADLGGKDILSEGQRCIIRRAVMITTQLEMMEQKWAASGGEASAKQIEVYQRATNTLRRVIETLGLHRGRVPREVNAFDDPAFRVYQEELNAP